MTRYKVEELKEKAVTERDLLILGTIEEKSKAPHSSFEQIALKLNSCVQQVASLYHHYLRGHILWLNFEEEKLQELFHRGLSDQEIANEMTIKSTQVQSRRKKLGLNRLRRIENEELFIHQLNKCINNKLTIEEAANQLSCSKSNVINYCKKHGLSFRKYGSDNHLSKVNSYDRALICTLRDIGYQPEHISKVVDHSLNTIYAVLYYTPSTETVDLSQNDRAMKLLNCEIHAGHYLTPAEIELFNKDGIDAYISKTGSTEAAALMAFVYRNKQRKCEIIHETTS
ncbi:hypothetical protein [Pseudoalteromonas shioyasakiensis]|uniref:hypothetical protein n=1 Tax=Pseudoalteromonas shioyasakiensis TaxID=1190813 RepID=UPI001C3CB7B7|nr:hypothetical protein [Pseudoalteromonas shioyasakiensis]|tara:strand:+ start:307 stop:1158 length:852 start_codon:yes stop_codon:yes gene_type:complete